MDKAPQATGDARKLQLLLRFNQLISRRIELKPMIAEAMTQARELVSADRITLWLADEESGQLYTFVGEGLENEIRIRIGEGVAGIAARERRVVVVNDAYSSPLFNPEVDKRSGYHTKSLLAVPMQSMDGKLIGVFQAINRLDEAGSSEHGEFTEEDSELFASMAAIAAVFLENAVLYDEQQRQFRSFIVTLAQSVDSRDQTTSNHTKLVTGLSVAIAQEMGLSRRTVERIRIAAVLHDYGKIGIPDNVLQKPGSLDEEERAMMRSHVLKTILLLRRINFSRELRDIPRIAGMHHEKLDGSGYPFGLRGDEIPLEGRILAVADIFQALTQTRPYKQGMAVPEALSELRVMTRAHRDRYDNESGMHVDPLVVEALARILARENDDLGIFDEASKWERMLQGQII
ncbi:HD domain-containing protein [bacterium]|nr:HD domain-containing protein [bacterium]MCB1220463.1 HD domain-containing protein [bacterium]UNM08125.1 MAG: HD domain-containing protein [Planctomycetales bacterium]